MTTYVGSFYLYCTVLLFVAMFFVQILTSPEREVVMTVPEWRQK